MRGVIFDLDHTLFDRYGTIAAISEEFCRHFNCAVSPETFTSIWTEVDKKYTYDGWRKVYGILVERGIFTDEPGYENYKSFLKYAFTKTSVSLPYAIPTLVELKSRGYLIGIITNGGGDIQNSKIDHLGLRPYVDEIIVCGEFGMEKPDIAPFLEMAKRLKCSPNELVYVGDNPYNDVEASAKAGYTPIWVKTTGTWPEDKPKPIYRVDNVSLVPERLKQIEKR